MNVWPPDAAHDVPLTVSNPAPTGIPTRVEWIEASGARFEASIVVPPGESGAGAIGLFRELSMVQPPKPDPSPELLLEPARMRVADQEVIRRTVPAGVKTEIVRADGLRGVMFVPSSIRHARPVLCLTGSSGGYAVRVAGTLAGHGFVTLALAYFGVEGTPGDLVEIPLESLERGIAWLRRRSAAEHVAVVGRSKGGELALLLGAMFDSVSAVVAYVPSSQTQPWVADDVFTASWTHRGEPLPWAPLDTERNPPANPRLTIRPGYEATLEDPETVERTAIPIERTNGPLLLVSGGRDAMWPSAVFSERVVARARARGFGFSVRHLEYPEAGHLVGLPHQPLRPSEFNVFEHGGTPEANARASSHSWPEVVSFLGSEP